MRRLRPLFLLAIAGIAGYLGNSYYRNIDRQRREAPEPPRQLPDRVKATASDWHWEKSSDGGGPDVSVRAKDFRQIAEPNRFELQKVELKICQAGKKTCDVVLSDRAEFDIANAYLYSEGEADITMGVPSDEESEAPAGRIVHIKSSGIRFDSKTGKAETDREVTFILEKGEGKAVGAVYDPATKNLLLRHQAKLIWKDKRPNSRAMIVESDEVTYKESESKVHLSPWSKFTRGTLVMEAKAATVTLDKNGIRLVETTEAKGADTLPKRTVAYAADELTMHFTEKSEIERISGRKNARLVATSAQGVNTTQANQVEMEFDPGDEGSLLKKVTATGTSSIESRPAIDTARPTPDTRLLRSEVIELRMRPGGEEIDAVDTLSPGTLEFLPNRPGQKKRRVEGERFHFAYAAGNQLESFRATKATTRTENEPKKGQAVAPSTTSSTDMLAQFAPKTGEMIRLEQSGNFRYQEGDRKAKAERAILQNGTEQITLIQGARVWDQQGATSADQIVLDQKTSDFRAEGNVESSRLPDKKGGGSTMLSKDEATQARAARMSTREKQMIVLYEGNAVLWQGSSRLQADRIEIDRTNSVLIAQGNVFSQLLDQRKESSKKPKPKSDTPVFTLIRAAALVYTDKDRIAHYTGGATLKRGPLDVSSREIKAFLKEQSKEKDGESSLDKATADGSVVILQSAPDRVKRGTAEHAEYIVAEERVRLEGGQPELNDSVKGVTRGKELIYFANDDRLVVNGVPQQPAVSKVRRK